LGLRVRQWIDGDVRLGVVTAALAADPLAVPAFVVVAVEGEAVAIQAQGIALGVVAPFQQSNESNRAGCL
jgi:hypothetical protein